MPPPLPPAEHIVEDKCVTCTLTLLTAEVTLRVTKDAIGAVLQFYVK